MRKMKKILIFRNSSLDNFIVGIPAIKIISKKFFDHEIYYLSLQNSTKGAVNANEISSNKDFIKEYIFINKNEIKLDDIFVCYHDDKDNCNCRKPKPGLLLQARKKWNIDFKKSFMIGDRWRDIQAGEEEGCKTIFLDYNYKDIKPKNPSFVTDTLLNAVNIIEKFSNEKKEILKNKNIL